MGWWRKSSPRSVAYGKNEAVVGWRNADDDKAAILRVIGGSGYSADDAEKLWMLIAAPQCFPCWEIIDPVVERIMRELFPVPKQPQDCWHRQRYRQNEL